MKFLFPDFLYLGAILGGALCSGLSMLFWQPVCRRLGWLDYPGPRKIHQQPIPVSGGFAVGTGVFVPSALVALSLLLGLWPDTVSGPLLEHGLIRRGPQLLILYLGGAAMFGIGWWDDRKNLRPLHKLGLQALVAFGVAVAGMRVTLFVPVPAIQIVLTVLWILAVTNAVNIIDNMNGLCAGLSAIACFYFGIYAALWGQYLTASLAFLSLGAFLGFLPFNFPKAQAFLGDAGSHLAGFFLAVLALLPDYYNPSHPLRSAVFYPLFILGVPLGDMVRVSYVRWRLGHPIFEGDTRHLSHELVRRGLSQTTAVLLIWLGAVVSGAMPFLLERFFR